MLNYEGLAQAGAKQIARDMLDKMMDGNYCINKAVITVDVDNNTMTVDTVRRDPLGIMFEGSVTIKLKIPE